MFVYIHTYTYTHIYTHMCVCMHWSVSLGGGALYSIPRILREGKKIWKWFFCSWTFKCLESEWNFHQISRSNLPAKVFCVKVQSSNKRIIRRFCVLLLGHLPSLLFLHTLVVPRSVGGQVDKLALGHTNVKWNRRLRECALRTLWAYLSALWLLLTPVCCWAGDCSIVEILDYQENT